MSEFKGFITNHQFAGSYNALLTGDPKDCTKGFVFVEDDSDANFWEEFISQYYPDEYTFRTSSKSSQKVTGKRFLESIYDTASSKIIIAVDSDYDYIASKDKPEHAFNQSKYIIHTYGFSRESVQLEKNSLREFFRRCKWTVSHNIDIIKFLEEFSIVSFNGLAQYLVLLKRNDYDSKYQKDFDICFNVLNERLVNEELYLDNSIINNIRNNLDKFFDDKNISTANINDEKDFLINISINEYNAYRFISGHVFFDLINKIYSDTIIQLKKKEVEIIKSSQVGKEIGNRIAQMTTEFKDSFSFKTHCNLYPINREDEVHKLILLDIKNIKN